MAIVGGVPFRIPGLLALYPNACIIVSAAWGADLAANPATWVWTDITTDVRQADGGLISISPMGRSDETSTAQPAGCSFELDNLSGKYTAYNSASTYWPNVRRNTPIKVEVNLTGNPVDTDIRFEGYATGWKPTWDISGALPVVTVTAQGITRRLSQGKNPLLSSMRRSYDVDPVRPVAYWSLEGGKDATVAYDVISGAASAVGGFTGLVTDNAGATQFGVADLGLGSDAVANIAGGWNLDLNLPAGIAATGQVALQWSVAFGTTVRTGTYSKCGIRLDPRTAPKHLAWNVYVNDSGLIEVQWLEADSAFGLAAGPTTVYSAGSENIFDGQPRVFHLNLAASGGTNVAWSLYENDVQLSFGTVTPSFSGAMNAPPYRSASFSGAKADQIAALGHVAVYTTNFVPVRYAALNAHRGELATDRLTRLCAEQGVPITITGTSTTTMGPQGMDAFLPLLRECETADQGVLFDGQGPGLGYVARDARYNAAPAMTLDMAANQVADPFEPVDDDQRDRNVAKVDRKGGGSYTYPQTDGPKGTDAIGVYDTSLTLNVDSDAVLPDYASWITHLGTTEGFRYPRLNLDVAAVPALASAWVAAGISSRIDVAHAASVAPQHPTADVRLLLEGWSEQLSPFDWAVQGNTSQYDPWAVGVLAADVGDTNPLVGHLDTDGSTTDSAAAAGASSIIVATPSGPLWTTDSDDFPQDVIVGGQRVSISGIAPAAAQLITHTVNARNTPFQTVLGPSMGTVDLRIVSLVSVAAVGDYMRSEAVVRYVNANNYYALRVHRLVGGAVDLQLIRTLTGTGTTLAAVSSVVTWSPGISLHLAVQMIGSTLRGRIWRDDEAERTAWEITATDANIAAGQVGATSLLPPSNTNTLPVTMISDLTVVTPQTFTVQLGGRQVVYPIPSGSAVNVQQPLILAL